MKLGKVLLQIYRRLLRWREYVPAVARAAKDLLGPETKVYVVGGAAEDRLTVASDVDVLIISPKVLKDPHEKLKVILDIRERAVDKYGLPWDYPIDVHLYRPEEFEEVKGLYGRMIEVRS